MYRLWIGLALWLCALPAFAQGLSALARVDAATSGIEDKWFGRTELRLGLNQGVPFRVFVLDGPPRLVVDFREVAFDGLEKTDLLRKPGRITDVRFGPFQPGWSRLVADLSGPMIASEVGLPVDPATGLAQLQIALVESDAETFAKTAAGYVQPDLNVEAAAPRRTSRPDNGRFVVMIDPGHGGVDPGAIRDGINEKTLMLKLARSLRDALRRGGDIEVVLTRDADVFVSLPGRIALAHQAKADIFISLHADALEEGGARGATVYTLSNEASDRAAAQLAAQHDRADIIAGLDLTQSDDQVAGVLMDLARQETTPRTDALADTLVRHIKASGAPVYSKPRRRAAFSVLKSADIPSVLVEVGFISDARDLKNLRDPVWRAMMVEAIADAVVDWRREDQALRPLVRK